MPRLHSHCSRNCSSHSPRPSRSPLIVIQYDFERMFYDRSCAFDKYQVTDLKDFIANRLYSNVYLDYKEEVDELREKLIKVYETEGEDAAIIAMEKAQPISCEKIKVFKGKGALKVLNFMENY
jgi:hypothetical protein